jgi:catechol 2,3-dioxygenase-like lactoylglutathione lyase family enzyme
VNPAPPSHAIAKVTLVVRDYDEAIDFFTRCLGFVVHEDVRLSADKRWVVVGPAAGGGAALLLAKAARPEQLARVGDQTGGRVFLFLHTDDFNRDFDRLTAHGVRFVEGPREEPYGRVGVFEDLYGNRWDLVESRPGGASA